MINVLRQGKYYISDGNGIYTEFVCSSAADVANLPTGKNSDKEDKPRPGSTAVVPGENGGAASVYMLSNERSWVLLAEG